MYFEFYIKCIDTNPCLFAHFKCEAIFCIKFDCEVVIFFTKLGDSAYSHKYFDLPIKGFAYI